MARAGDLIVVHMLEQQAVGSYFDRKRWPLHITLLPWFGATQPQHEPLRRGLSQLALTMPPITVAVGEQAMFGPNHDMPVHLVANKTELQSLHQALLGLTKLLQLPMQNPQYTGPDFTPHVSQYEDRHVNIGDTITVGDVYVVQLIEGRTCQIIGRFELKGRNG
jgi:2'-5' RNA ligase